MNKFLVLAALSFSLVLIACKSPGGVDGASYYLDPVKGNDSNDGTSPENPWRSLEKIATIELKAGDRVLLRAGQVFRSSLKMNNLHGTIVAPIILSTYGKGRAILDSGDSLAILAEDCSYFICKNLIVKGSGRLAGNEADGLLFRRVQHGVVDRVDAFGYLYSGIHVVGGSDITITHVYAHDNGFCGIFAESGEPEYGVDGSKFKTLKRVYIGYSVAENNPGCPLITDNHSGNGILVAGAVNGMIEYCEAMNNGWDMPREGNGPVGIWAYMSDSITIQHCYSHHNKTSQHGKDGGGFDFDGGMRNSIMQYNLSAFNEGAGYGIFQYAGATEWTQNVARYNISFNDGSKNSHAGIFVWCDPIAQRMKNFHAYNNTIVSEYGLGVNFEPGAYEGFVFENNIFLITGETDRFIDGKFSMATFNNNLYWSSYHSGLHKSQPIQYSDAASIQSDPKIVLPGNHELILIKTDSLAALRWFDLPPGSPCLQAGIVIQNNGGFDFWSNPVSSNDNPNLGAWQGN